MLWLLIKGAGPPTQDATSLIVGGWLAVRQKPRLENCKVRQKRGQFAYASFKTHQQVDPQTERDNIGLNVLSELKNLEKRLKDLL
jgi:hypothetical protein